MFPCLLYAELMMLVAREYFLPPMGSKRNLVPRSLSTVSSTIGAMRDMKGFNSSGIPATYFLPSVVSTMRTVLALMSETPTHSDSEDEFDLSPSPRVLPMLGEINLEQWRCIAELVDNSVDGFLHAMRSGTQIEDPFVQVNLPEADREDAIVQIVDNGPGMTTSGLSRAVKAGWSGNNPTDNLGLFGMGFNIATARLGGLTEVWTTRDGESEWHGLNIDFERLQRRESFKTPHLRSPKPDPATHGTKIVVRNLKPSQRQWLARSANQGLVRKRLAQAYAAMLSPDGFPIGFKLHLNNKVVRARPFCLWDEERSAQVPEFGEVFAYQALNYPLGERLHCSECMNWVIANTQDPEVCPVCGAKGGLRKRQRRVHGWIGIQRYSDTTDFGIDFIRNGRKIELASKDLFVWRGDNGDEPEYPIDDPSRRGRIVGEVHLDHCRVNFAKERFDRSDPAWSEMVTLVRGEGPLRPEKARELGYTGNTSPLFKLYKAFRRLRPHSNVAGGWKRLLSVPNNNIAKELAAKFFDGHPEYQSDDHWWKLIEEEDNRLLGQTSDSVEQDEGDELPPGLIDDAGATDAVDTENGSDNDREHAEAKARARRRPIPSLTRTFVFPGAGQSFNVASFECETDDPDLGSESPWSLILGEVSTRTYHFLYRSGDEVFRSITMDPIDALLIELSNLTLEYMRSGNSEDSFSEVLKYYRDNYAQTASLDARQLSAEADDVLQTFAISLLENAGEAKSATFFEELSEDQRAEVMRSLARKGVKPAPAIADGTFLLQCPRDILEVMVDSFPELIFDGNYWDTSFSDLDYEDVRLTEQAKGQVKDRARAIVADAAWLADADPSILSSMKKEELIRGLMSVSLLRPDREVS